MFKPAERRCFRQTKAIDIRMIPVSCEEISEVLKEEPRGIRCGQTITSVEIDSRKVTDGALFVAMKGERVDSHIFIEEAFKQGAVCCFSSEEYAASHEIAIPEGKLLFVCGDPVKAMGDLAAYYRSRLSIPVIAVTGSVGKTSAKDMIAAALSGGLKTFKTPGNLNNRFGLPMAVFQIEADTQAAVLEMGMNHFGEIRYLSRIARPDLGVITNIGVSHIEFLGSQQGILKAKTEMLEVMDEDDCVFLCGDDPLLREYAGTMKIPFQLYGFDEGCNIRALGWGQEGDRLWAQVQYEDQKVRLECETLGRHMVYSMLAAYGIGRRLGLSEEELTRGIASFVPTAMRMNIYQNERFRVLDDSYNASPASMKAALDVLFAQKGGRRVAILGDMFEMGFYSEQGHREVGAYAAGRGLDTLITAGLDARFIAEEAQKIKPGLEIHAFENLQELKKKVFSLLRSGDIILVKASRGMAFDQISQMIK